MKFQNVVRILMFLAILGMVTFPVVHLNAESNEENTEATESTEKKSESAKDSQDVKVKVETKAKFVESETKLKEASEKLSEAIKEIEELDIDHNLNKGKMDVDALLKEIKEKFSSLNDLEGVKVEISEPTVIIGSSDESEELEELKKKIKKLIEDGNLDSDEIAIQLKELVDNMKIFKAAAQDGEIVTVLQYGPNVTTKILKDVKGNKELLDKIKELASDEDLASDELVKKVQELVKNMKNDKSVVLDKDNVKVHTFGPYVTTKILKDPKNLKKLGENIRKLSSDENLETEELAEKVLKLIHGMKSDIDIITKHGFEGGKVFQFESSTPISKVSDTKLDKLEERIVKLETKIEKLLNKLDEAGRESSEDK